MKRITILLTMLALAVALAWAGEKAESGKSEKAKDSTQVANQDSAKETKKVDEPDWITTETGLKYVDLVVGEGDEIVPGTKASLHYTLWLVGEDGKKGKRIQSSKDNNQPYTTTIPGQLIAAWNEGVPGMKVGGTRLLLSPPELAYGPRGMGGMIPPNATLFFEIECVEIVK